MRNYIFLKADSLSLSLSKYIKYVTFGPIGSAQRPIESAYLLSFSGFRLWVRDVQWLKIAKRHNQDPLRGFGSMIEPNPLFSPVAGLGERGHKCPQPPAQGAPKGKSLKNCFLKKKFFFSFLFIKYVILHQHFSIFATRNLAMCHTSCVMLRTIFDLLIITGMLVYRYMIIKTGHIIGFPGSQHISRAPIPFVDP